MNAAVGQFELTPDLVRRCRRYGLDAVLEIERWKTLMRGMAVDDARVSFLQYVAGRRRKPVLRVAAALLLVLAACRRESPTTERSAPTATTTQAAQLEPSPVAPILPDPELQPLPKVTPKRVQSFADIAPTARPAKRRAVSSSTPVAIPVTPQMRGGIGYPIANDLTRFRVNLLLVNNAEMPAQIWARADWKATIRAKDGSFPVEIWRMRAGVSTHVRTVYVPSGPMPAYTQIAIDSMTFRREDVLIVEWTPALFAQRNEASNTVSVPLLSVIDNASGDPTAMPGTWIGFEGAR